MNAIFQGPVAAKQAQIFTTVAVMHLLLSHYTSKMAAD